MTHTAPFAQIPKVNTAVLTLAGIITNDTPTNTELIATAGTDGALLTKVTAMPRATTTANPLYLFVSQDDGVTKRLIDSVLMEAHTVDTSTAIPVTTFSDISQDTPIRLESNEKLYVSAGVALADGIVITARLTDF